MHSISYIHRQVDAESRLQRIEIMEGDGGRRRSGGNEAPIHNTQPPPERLARNRGVVEFRVREQRRVVRLWGHPSLGTPVFGDTHCPTDCSTVQAKVPVPKPSKAKVGVPMPKVGVPMPPCHHATMPPLNCRFSGGRHPSKRPPGHYPFCHLPRYRCYGVEVCIVVQDCHCRGLRRRGNDQVGNREPVPALASEQPLHFNRPVENGLGQLYLQIRKFSPGTGAAMFGPASRRIKHFQIDNCACGGIASLDQGGKPRSHGHMLHASQSALVYQEGHEFRAYRSCPRQALAMTASSARSSPFIAARVRTS